MFLTSGFCFVLVTLPFCFVLFLICFLRLWAGDRWRKEQSILYPHRCGHVFQRKLSFLLAPVVWQQCLPRDGLAWCADPHSQCQHSQRCQRDSPEHWQYQCLRWQPWGMHSGRCWRGCQRYRMLKMYPTPSPSLLHSLPCPLLVFLCLSLLSLFMLRFLLSLVLSRGLVSHDFTVQNNTCTHIHLQDDNFQVPSSFCLLWPLRPLL